MEAAVAVVLEQARRTDLFKRAAVIDGVEQFWRVQDDVWRSSSEGVEVL